MKNDKSRQAIIAVIAVLFVCGGSYLTARGMADRAATVNTTASSQTQPSQSYYYPSTQPTYPSTLPTYPSTQPTTIPTTEPSTQASTQGTTGSQSTITTFPVEQTSTTAPTESTTQPTTEPTTSEPATLPPMTTQPTTQTPETTTRKTSSGDSVFDNGLFSYMYNPDGNFYYTYEDPWQRALGFNEIYDMGAPFVVMYYDTVRLKFNYNNKDWLVQLWKGQYGGVFIGAEIGVYNKPMDRELEHYDCANNDDSLYMSMTMYRKGKEVFTRDYMKYWWCTGFVPGKLDKFSDRSELSVQARITMKDQAMLTAFTRALEENGFVKNSTYTVDGLDVHLRWT